MSLRVKAKREDIKKALTGHYREEYLFELGQCYKLYWQNISQTDKQIEELLKSNIADKSFEKPYKSPKNKQYQKNDPDFNMDQYSFQMSGGVELLEINGVGVSTVLTLMSETSLNLSKFKTAKQFASWLGFAPNRKVSGGKELSSRTRKKTNPLAKVIRDAANAAGNSKSRLDYFRHLAYRKREDSCYTIGATARKIAVIIYNMLTQGKKFCYEYAKEETKHIIDNKIKNIAKTVMKYKISKTDLESALI